MSTDTKTDKVSTATTTTEAATAGAPTSGNKKAVDGTKNTFMISVNEQKHVYQKDDFLAKVMVEDRSQPEVAAQASGLDSAGRDKVLDLLDCGDDFRQALQRIRNVTLFDVNLKRVMTVTEELRAETKLISAVSKIVFCFCSLDKVKLEAVLERMRIPREAWENIWNNDAIKFQVSATTGAAGKSTTDSKQPIRLSPSPARRIFLRLVVQSSGYPAELSAKIAPSHAVVIRFHGSQGPPRQAMASFTGLSEAAMAKAILPFGYQWTADESSDPGLFNLDLFLLEKKDDPICLSADDNKSSTQRPALDCPVESPFSETEFHARLNKMGCFHAGQSQLLWTWAWQCASVAKAAAAKETAST